MIEKSKDEQMLRDQKQLLKNAKKHLDDIHEYEERINELEAEIVKLKEENKVWYKRARKWDSRHQQLVYFHADKLATIRKQIERYKHLSKTESGKLVEETSYIIIPLKRWEAIIKEMGK